MKSSMRSRRPPFDDAMFTALALLFGVPPAATWHGLTYDEMYAFVKSATALEGESIRYPISELYSWYYHWYRENTHAIR
jgi:hypothetical protein